MLEWLKKHWAPVTAGLVVGGVGTLIAVNVKADAKAKQLPGGGAPKPEPSGQGTTAIVLAIGVQAVQAAAGDTLAITLPVGAKWVGASVIAGPGTQAVPVDGEGNAYVTVPPAIAFFIGTWQDTSGIERQSLLLFIPPGQKTSDAITDPSTVAYAEALVQQMAQKGTVPGTSVDADFISNLTAFQKDFNATLASMNRPDLPTLNTVGTLDYLTYAALLVG